MDLKVGLKVGTVELQFEGSKELFESKFESVFNELLEKTKGRQASAPASTLGAADSQKAFSGIQQMTIKSIAAKFSVKGGSDLTYAAIASLAIFKQKETFTRQEINDEMKLATGYYKQSYSSGNFSGYLNSLSKKNVIIETSKDTYALTPAARSEMEQKLA